MPILNVQQRFTAGELDPLMVGRDDLEKRYAAAETMTNAWAINQGGFKRRDGLKYIDRIHRIPARETSPTITATNGGTGSNANDNNTATLLTTTTNISTTNPYVVVHYDLGSAKDVAFIDVKTASLTAGTSDEFYIQYSTDNVSWTSLGNAVELSTTAVTTRRRARVTARYFRFARIGSTDLGTAKVNLGEFHVYEELSTLSVSRILPFEFSPTQSYILVLTDSNAAVYKDGVFQTDLAIPFRFNELAELKWTQSLDTAILVQEDNPPLLIQRNGADDNWISENISFDYIPKYDFVPVSTAPAGSITPSAKEGSITITGVGTNFTSADVGQYIDGNGGRARIVARTSTTVITAVTEIPFYNTNSIPNAEWTIESGFEDVWSPARGYPRTATFHEGRLYFGGSKSRPQTIWGSRVGQFYNFDRGTLLDDEALDITLDTDQMSAITNIISQRTLQVFTVNGEFIIPVGSDESPITPATAAFKRISNNGSEPDIKVALLDGGAFYIQRGGTKLLEFRYADETQAFQNAIISLLSGHLIKTPIDMAVRKSISTSDASYIIMVNSDGTATVGCVLLTEDIIALTPTITEGKFKSVGVDVEDIYVTVERTIDGSTTRYLEKFDSDHVLDSSVRITSGLPTDTFSGLDNLEGETVKVRADDSALADVTIASGAATVARDVDDYVEFGMDFDFEVKTLPVEIPRYGSLLGRKKRISEVILRLDNTQDIVINGNQVSFRGFGVSSTSPFGAPPFFTGVKKVRGLRGWDVNGQITITQNNPSPLTLTALGYKVGI